MGIWTRSKKEHVFHFQPPPYLRHWQCDEDVVALDSEATKKGPSLPRYSLHSVDADPRSLVESKVSTCHRSHLQQRCCGSRPDEGGTVILKESRPESQSASQSVSPAHCRNHGRNSTHPSCSGKDWLRNFKKKHSREHKKGSSVGVSPASPRFIAISVPTNPPVVTNKILLDQDTISLSQPDRDGDSGEPLLKITLATTLLENTPYTICSDILQRNQVLEAALAHFEIFEIETGRVLSERPLPGWPSHVERATDRKTYKDRKAKRVCGSITRRTCTELHPNRTSLLAILAEPSPCKSSTERLFDGLCISDPATLISRRLGLRLRPKMALWSARTMAEVFGFGEVLTSGWPDGYYGKLLEMSCSDSIGEELGWAEFRVVE